MKDFFRPTTAKIVIALLFPFYFGVEGAISSGQASYHSVFSWAPFVFMIIGVIYLWATTDTVSQQLSQATAGQKVIAVFSEVLLALVIDYVLACLVVAAYKKVRNALKHPPVAGQTTGQAARRSSL